MAAHGRHREVLLWLERLFNGDPVPNFTVNEASVGALHQLACETAERDRDARVHIADMRQRTHEYRHEAARTERVLESIGLGASSLSRSGTASVGLLSGLADTLDLQVTDSTSFMLGLGQLAEEVAVLESQLAAAELVHRERQADLLEQRRRSRMIKAAMARLEEQATIEASQGAERAARTAFLLQKSADYSRQSKQLEEDIQTNGYDESLTHSAIAKVAKEYAELVQATHSLRRQVQSYKNLPPDLSLAGVKLEEARRLNASLEVQIRRQNDLS